MMIIGIDPGNTGAVAYIYKDGKADVEDCPLVSGIIAPPVAALLLTNREIEHVFLELVAARPGQGVSSMFKFGANFGVWQGIIGALNLPLTLVTPQTWKKEFNLVGKKDDPDAGRKRALELFPSLTMFLSRKKDGGRADALLIAEYGRRNRK